jgi:SAM-dependent methyltransferase
MDDFSLLIDLHRDGARQGPGGEAETRLAVSLSGLAGKRGLRVADIGCGTGAATLVLAEALDAIVTAVDFLPEFIEELESAAERSALGDRIETHVASMDALPFEPGAFDAIWSEGAIYNMGFENGLRAWRPFLKPGGVLAVSELTWLTQERPAELERHWMNEYPQVATASVKIGQLEANGYSPIGYFPLPRRCWLDNYYTPMQDRFEAFLERHGHSAAATAVVDTERRELALYERYSAYYGYGYYLARRTEGQAPA